MVLSASCGLCQFIVFLQRNEATLTTKKYRNKKQLNLAKILLIVAILLIANLVPFVVVNGALC